MPFQKTWQNHIRTPVPPSVSPTAIISILRDHGFLIKLSPIVTRYEVASTETTPSHTNSYAERINYDVWENIAILGSLAKKEISFKCGFENTDDGVISWIQAPMGLTSKAEYVVKFQGSGVTDGEGEGWVLEEKIESSCSMFLKSFVEKTMVNVRKEMHQSIIKKAEERKE